jgi:ribosome-associated translation inhibitor RaiA
LLENTTKAPAPRALREGRDESRRAQAAQESFLQGAKNMTYSDESYNLRIELDTKGCDLSAGEISAMEDDLHTLRKLVEDFPVSNLYLTVIHHERSKDYHVKASLALPGKTLFTGDRDTVVHPAYDRCVRKLVKKVEAYKERMHRDAELSKQARGTHHTLDPTRDFDVTRLSEAVDSDDYAAFRVAADAFEEGLTQRIGRWVQRYPEIEASLGEAITISDIVEDVFLNAFDQFPRRPTEVPPGAWIESLIDSSVQALMQSPDEEFANISFARAILGKKRGGGSSVPVNES